MRLVEPDDVTLAREVFSVSTSDHPLDRERSRTRKRRLEEIFETAMDVALEERAVFLDVACAGDNELRRAVESLLEVERVPTLAPLPSGVLAVDLGDWCFARFPENRYLELLNFLTQS